MGGGVFRRLAVVVRTVLGGEKLGELPEVSVNSKKRSFVSMLMGREELPDDPLSDGGREAFLSLLFRPEALPCDPPLPPSGRKSFLGKLFSREVLPRDAERGSGSGSGLASRS